MMLRRKFLLFALLLGIPAAVWAAQRADRRSVEGVVSGPQGEPVKGAVVKLKNVKNLQIRSFITTDGGNYRYHGLDMDSDYELKAESGGFVSDTETVSSFNDARQVTVNLHLRKAE